MCSTEGPVPCPPVYHAIFLEELTTLELVEKIANLYSISPQHIHRVYQQGPTGIHVVVSNEVSAVPTPAPGPGLRAVGRHSNRCQKCPLWGLGRRTYAPRWPTGFSCVPHALGCP